MVRRRHREVIMVNYRDVDVLLADVLNIYLALIIEYYLLHHSEGEVTPELSQLIVLTLYRRVAQGSHQSHQMFHLYKNINIFQIF